MSFDQDQQVVVDHVEGAMQVIAGAGSGKTKAIIGRATALIERHRIPPEQHLMLTFSRKAADEMRGRISESLPNTDLSRMIIGTFHSFGYRLIRERPELCNRKAGMTILDERDVSKILKDLSEVVNIDIEREEGKKFIDKMYGVYSLACNELLSVFDSSHGNQIDLMLEKAGITGSRKHLFYDLFRLYEDKKKEQNVLDFDDLLVLPVRGLSRRGGGDEWRNRIAKRYRFVTVDEAQDTNKAQYEMVKLIAGHSNVILVGDDDQSIYSWRGANPTNMQLFRADMGAKLVFLPRNYRSTQAIIESASNHVALNKKRFDKKPYAVRQGGDLIRFSVRESSRTAAWDIVNSISDHLRSGGQAKDVAILYRVNRLSRLLEYAFLSAGIPYRVVGGLNFEQRAEIRLAIAVGRMVVNPYDESAFHTIGEVLSGIGKASVEKVIAASVATQMPLLEAPATIPKKARQALDQLAGVLSFLREVGGPTALVGQLVADDGMAAMQHFAKKDKPETLTTRERNLSMLDKMLGEWCTNVSEDQSPWEVFFEKIVGSQGDTTQDEDRVTLSTIHRSKGLEWSIVHVFGYSDGLIPLTRSARSNDELADEEDDVSAADLEEERRLSYVGITRAKQFCCLWHCNEYDYGYESRSYPQSRFTEELTLDVDAPEDNSSFY